MFVKTVALLTMLSMSINGFLPKSITDLSGNSFLVDAISCQSIFLDFLHFSDRSLMEIAVKTVDDLSVSAPLSFGHRRSPDGEPWANVCRVLSQSAHRIPLPGIDRATTAVPPAPAPAKNNPSSTSMDNTTSDYILLNNAVRMDMVSRQAARGYVQTTTGICMVVSRFLAGHSDRMAVYDTGVLCAAGGCTPQGNRETVSIAVRSVPAYTAERFSCYLPRSGIEASAMIKGIF